MEFGATPEEQPRSRVPRCGRLQRAGLSSDLVGDLYNVFILDSGDSGLTHGTGLLMQGFPCIAAKQKI
jgi:hypothetical protein